MAYTNSAEGDEKKQTLEKYGQDLTAKAKEGKLDPVIGRDEEIRRVVEILSRRKKNNPVLIGEPGVGKTAIVEGLPAALWQAMFRKALKIKLCTRLTWQPLLPAPNTAASLKND